MTSHEPDDRGLRISREVPTTATERAAVARALIDQSSYMTPATADAGGVPWASPVWFAPVDGREPVWVSSADAPRHSRNIAARPRVAIVIFDSTQAPGAGQALYVSARAEEVAQEALGRCLRAFISTRARTATAWTAADVRPPARHRLYRAAAEEHFVLGARDERIAVDLGA
jgi:hypothetical protein